MPKHPLFNYQIHQYEFNFESSDSTHDVENKDAYKRGTWSRCILRVYNKRDIA